MSLTIRSFKFTDWNWVSKVYNEGIKTGIATFETQVPDYYSWDKKYIDSCRIVAELENEVVGFAVLSQVSERSVYKGVAEVSVYVSKKSRGQGIGQKLLNELILQSETNGFWTLQAGIFSQNKASIELHKKCGFRIIGVREKIGCLKGKWFSNQFLERRSKIIGI
jgi:phosphinothricin acetyltransferase